MLSANPSQTVFENGLDYYLEMAVTDTRSEASGRLKDSVSISIAFTCVTLKNAAARRKSAHSLKRDVLAWREHLAIRRSCGIHDQQPHGFSLEICQLGTDAK